MINFSSDRSIASKRTLPSLDGVRGMALLLVIFCHLGSAKIFLCPGVNFKDMGVLGVYLFFALSAFLLGSPYWSKTPEELFSVRLWSAYFLRRFQRIIPLYAITLVTLHELHQPLSAAVQSLPPHKIMEWLLMRDGEIQFWTIPVEVKFYFLLPLIILVFVGLWRKHIAAGILGTAGLIVALNYLILPLDNLWSLRMPIRIWHCLPVFLLGLTAGAMHSRVLQQKATPKWFAWVVKSAPWHASPLPSCPCTFPSSQNSFPTSARRLPTPLESLIFTACFRPFFYLHTSMGSALREPSAPGSHCVGWDSSASAPI